MSDALVQLAECCEAATGPNFELEREIADAVWRAKWGKRRPKDIAAQPCTASLDAAMTLVPEGWCIASLEWWPMTNTKAGVTLREVRENTWGMGYDETCGDARAHAATPALALTAAALRALAKEPTP